MNRWTTGPSGDLEKRSAVQPVGVEPTSTRVSDGCLAARPRLEKRKGQDSNLQGLFASPAFQAGAIVPLGSPFRIELSLQGSNLQPSG